MTKFRTFRLQGIKWHLEIEVIMASSKHSNQNEIVISGLQNFLRSGLKFTDFEKLQIILNKSFGSEKYSKISRDFNKFRIPSEF